MTRLKPTLRLPVVIFITFMSALSTENKAFGFQQPISRKLPTLKLPKFVASLSFNNVVTTKVAVEVPPIVDRQTVPSTMKKAVGTFFFQGDHGPLYVMFSIMVFTCWRVHLSSLDLIDGLVFGVTVIFWSLQEHILHDKALHSQVNWYGKDIHQEHHDKPYYHISIDPAPLLLGWMFTAHVAFRMLLPLPLALTATLAYSISGIFYEWAHYIVHTKVRFQSKFWKRVKENHLRHHVVSDEFWFAFSIPWIDDLFHTNPSVVDVQRNLLVDKKRRKEDPTIIS